MANRFDEVAKLLASGVSRRQALKVLGGSILGGIFGGKAVEDAGAYSAITYDRHKLRHGCKAHCQAAVVQNSGSTPTAATNKLAYQTCFNACLSCPGERKSNAHQKNPGGPDNMCADLTISGTTYRRAACCPSGAPCDPNRNFCEQTASGTPCAAPQTTCTVGGTSICCPRNSTCMNISGGPMCVMRCSTVVCNGQCCRSGYHCGTISGSGPNMCVPGVSGSASVKRAKKHK